MRGPYELKPGTTTGTKTFRAIGSKKQNPQNFHFEGSGGF